MFTALLVGACFVLGVGVPFVVWLTKLIRPPNLKRRPSTAAWKKRAGGWTDFATNGPTRTKRGTTGPRCQESPSSSL